MFAEFQEAWGGKSAHFLELVEGMGVDNLCWIILFKISLFSRISKIHKTKLDLRVGSLPKLNFFILFYLKTLFMFQWFNNIQTSPVHCLYALDLRLRCAFFFVHLNIKKKKNSFFLKKQTSFIWNIVEGIVKFLSDLD